MVEDTAIEKVHATEEGATSLLLCADDDALVLMNLAVQGLLACSHGKVAMTPTLARGVNLVTAGAAKQPGSLLIPALASTMRLLHGDGVTWDEDSLELLLQRYDIASGMLQAQTLDVASRGWDSARGAPLLRDPDGCGRAAKGPILYELEIRSLMHKRIPTMLERSARNAAARSRVQATLTRFCSELSRALTVFSGTAGASTYGLPTTKAWLEPPVATGSDADPSDKQEACLAIVSSLADCVAVTLQFVTNLNDESFKTQEASSLSTVRLAGRVLTSSGLIRGLGCAASLTSKALRDAASMHPDDATQLFSLGSGDTTPFEAAVHAAREILTTLSRLLRCYGTPENLFDSGKVRGLPEVEGMYKNITTHFLPFLHLLVAHNQACARVLGNVMTPRNEMGLGFVAAFCDRFDCPLLNSAVMISESAPYRPERTPPVHQSRTKLVAALLELPEPAASGSSSAPGRHGASLLAVLLATQREYFEPRSTFHAAIRSDVIGPLFGSYATILDGLAAAAPKPHVMPPAPGLLPWRELMAIVGLYWRTYQDVHSMLKLVWSNLPASASPAPPPPAAADPTDLWARMDREMSKPNGSVMQYAAYAHLETLGADVGRLCVSAIGACQAYVHICKSLSHSAMSSAINHSDSCYDCVTRKLPWTVRMACELITQSLTNSAAAQAAAVKRYGSLSAAFSALAKPLAALADLSFSVIEHGRDCYNCVPAMLCSTWHGDSFLYPLSTFAAGRPAFHNEHHKGLCLAAATAMLESDIPAQLKARTAGAVKSLQRRGPRAVSGASQCLGSWQKLVDQLQVRTPQEFRSAR